MRCAVDAARIAGTVLVARVPRDDGAAVGQRHDARDRLRRRGIAADQELLTRIARGIVDAAKDIAGRNSHATRKPPPASAAPEESR